MKKLKIIAVVLSAGFITGSLANPMRYSSDKIDDALMCASISMILSNTKDKRVSKGFYKHTKFFKAVYAEQMKYTLNTTINNGEFQERSMERRRLLDKSFDEGERQQLVLKEVSCFNWRLDVLKFASKNTHLSDKDYHNSIPKRKLIVSGNQGLTFDRAGKHIDVGFNMWDYETHKVVLDNINKVLGR